MGSFTQLAYHVVFGTKYRKPTIEEDIEERLYEYIGGIIRERKGRLVSIGGVMDHVHILAKLSPVLAVADVIRDVKAVSSKWINEQPKRIQAFEWQKGYAAFTVSYSQLPVIQSYIENQKEHHKEKSFREEYIQLLKRHGIDFRMEFLFEGEHHG